MLEDLWIMNHLYMKEKDALESLKSKNFATSRGEKYK